jgi:DHA2 family multidrug resistance protein-like MFS transporter
MTDVPMRAGPRDWISLVALAVPTLVVAIDMGVLYLALPALSADLGVNSIEQLWVLDIYGFVLAGFLVTMGKLGDRIGRRRLLLIGASAFAGASVIAAFAPTAATLIAARALLGVAGATLAPSALALLTAIFKDPKQQATAVAVFITCLMGGGAVGPIVGGLMLQQFWWGSVFLLGVPVMLALVAVGPWLLPEYRDPEPGRLDLVSVVLSLATVLPLIYGLKQLPQGLEVLPVAAVVVGLLAGTLFVRRQLRLETPLLDLRLFGGRTFRSALGIMLLGSASMAGIMLFFSQYLQLVVGLSPAAAGLAMVPSSIAVAVSGLIAPKIAQRLRPGVVIAAGLVVSGAGFIVLTQATATTDLWVVLGGVVLVTFGAGPFTSLCISLVMASVREEQAGSASAVSETGGEFGVAFGLAAFGTIGATLYTRLIEIPAGVPPAAAESAQHSLAEATAAAGSVPPSTAESLLASAREAFTSGMNGVAVAGAVLVAGLIVVSLYGLRDSGPIGSEDASTAEREDEPALERADSR